MMSEHYWLFYLIDEVSREEYMYDPNKYAVNQGLYAYTSIKKLSKLFRSQRNMKLFKMEEVDLNQQDIHYLAENCQNFNLVYYYGKTKDKGFHLSEYNIAVTVYERLRVEAEVSWITGTKVYQWDSISHDYFKKDYRMDLWNIKYWYFYDPEYHARVSELRRHGEAAIQAPIWGADYNDAPEDPKIDYLVAFLSLYAGLMKEV